MTRDVTLEDAARMLREGEAQCRAASATITEANKRIGEAARWYATVQRRMADVRAAGKESDIALRMAVELLLMTLEMKP